jgi:hypothetical protein
MVGKMGQAVRSRRGRLRNGILQLARRWRNGKVTARAGDSRSSRQECRGRSIQSSSDSTGHDGSPISRAMRRRSRQPRPHHGPGAPLRSVTTAPVGLSPVDGLRVSNQSGDGSRQRRTWGHSAPTCHHVPRAFATVNESGDCQECRTSRTVQSADHASRSPTVACLHRRWSRGAGLGAAPPTYSQMLPGCHAVRWPTRHAIDIRAGAVAVRFRCSGGR